MMVVLNVVVTNAETKFIKKSVKSGDYTNALKMYSSFSNTNAIYSTELEDECELRVFELSYTNVETPTNSKYSYMDIEYGIALESTTLDRTNPKPVDNEGTIINQAGFVVTNSIGEQFHVYDNGYKDGNATKKETAYPVYDSDGEEAGIIDINSMYYEKIYMFHIPLTLIKQYSGFTVYDIKSIKIVNNVGNTYASISFGDALNYSSEYFSLLDSMVSEYNKCVDLNDFKTYNDMYDEWEETYLTFDGANTYLRAKDYVNGLLWFKIIISLILYVLFVLIIGDILVGKRRIISLFQRLGQQQTNQGGSFTNPNGAGKKEEDAPDLMNKK